MKKFLIILLGILLSFHSQSQDIKLIKETVDFIIETYNVPEINPIHYKESSLVDSIFKIVVFDNFGIKRSDNEISTEYLFNL